jgi:hypothetical protein
MIAVEEVLMVRREDVRSLRDEEVRIPSCERFAVSWDLI